MPDGIHACLFDMDGVLTETATVHAAAWKEMFDAFLKDREGQAPFDESSDYGPYVGYVAGVTQGTATLDGIHLTITLVPGIIGALGAIPLFWYRLDERKHAEIVAEHEQLLG